MVDFNAKDFFQRRFYALNARITELKYLIAICKNNVVVLLVLKRALVMCRVLAKLMLANQATINQKLDGIVQRGPRHSVLLVFHPRIQHLHIEVPAYLVDLSKNSKTLGCFPMLVHLEITGEDVLNAVLYPLCHSATKVRTHCSASKAPRAHCLWACCSASADPLD